MILAYLLVFCHFGCVTKSSSGLLTVWLCKCEVASMVMRLILNMSGDMEVHLSTFLTLALVKDEQSAVWLAT